MISHGIRKREVCVMKLTLIKTLIKRSIITRDVNSNRIFIGCSIGFSALSTIANVILLLWYGFFEIFPTSSFSIMRLSYLALVFNSKSIALIVCAIPTLILISLSLFVLAKRKIPAVILSVYYVLDTFLLIFLFGYEIFVNSYFSAYYFWACIWCIWILILLYHFLKLLKLKK